MNRRCSRADEGRRIPRRIAGVGKISVNDVLDVKPNCTNCFDDLHRARVGFDPVPSIGEECERVAYSDDR